MVNSLTQAVQFGLRDKQVNGKNFEIVVPLYSELMAQGAGEAVKGIIGTANWDWKLTDDGTKALHQVLRRQVRLPAVAGGAHLLRPGAALRRRGASAPAPSTRRDVIKALEGFEFDGMGNGPTLYRAADHQCFKEVLVVHGKENPENQFDLLEVVEIVPTRQGHLRAGQSHVCGRRPRDLQPGRLTASWPPRALCARRSFRPAGPDGGTGGDMDAILLQVLNGLDKGGAYALIALGLTLIFGTLGVVNFAHGALFMLGAFCAVTFRNLLTMHEGRALRDRDDRLGHPARDPHAPTRRSGSATSAQTLIDYSVPLSILLAIPVMLLIGLAMERGLIQHFYKRPHADQILVTFGLAIVLQEIIKAWFGANPIPQPAPDGAARHGRRRRGDRASPPATSSIRGGGFVYFAFSAAVIGGVFAFLQFTTFGMVVRAGMADRETVGLLGIDIDRRFTWCSASPRWSPASPASCTRRSCSPDYHLGMDFLVLCFVVVVVGGMGSLGGAVLAGFLLGILQSFASMNEVKDIFPGIDQIIIYLVAVVVLLARPRGLFGRKGVMET